MILYRVSESHLLRHVSGSHITAFLCHILMLCFIRVFYPEHGVLWCFIRVFIVVYIVGRYPGHSVDGVLDSLSPVVSTYIRVLSLYDFLSIRVLVYIYSLASLSGSLVILPSGSLGSYTFLSGSHPLPIPFYPGHFPFSLGHVLFPSGFHPLLSPSHPGHIRFPSTVPRLFRPSGARASIFFSKMLLSVGGELL